MKHMFVCAIGILAISLVQASCNGKNQAARDGGPCKYVSFAGKARITAMAPAPASEHNCPEKPMKITFEFTPDNIADRQKYTMKNYNDSACYMRINDGANPPQKWITLNKIEIGKIYKCIRTEIASGTCTPVIYKFPELNLFPEKGCN